MLRLFLALLFLCIGLDASYASPGEFNRAKSSMKKLAVAEKELAKSLRKLTKAERAKLKRSARGLDSDGDGLPDSLEGPLGANRCDADSDDDGIDDSEDSDEDNSGDDSNDDSDGVEVETKGTISSFNDPVLVVGTTQFQITPQTVFLRGLRSKLDLVPGKCVDVKGLRSGEVVLIDRIKLEDPRECDGR